MSFCHIKIVSLTFDLVTQEVNLLMQRSRRIKLQNFITIHPLLAGIIQRNRMTDRPTDKQELPHYFLPTLLVVGWLVA